MAHDQDRNELPASLQANLQQLREANGRLTASCLRQQDLLNKMQANLAETRATRDNLRSIMNGMLEEVWYCDREARVSPLNSAASHLLPSAAREHPALPIQEWLSRLEPRGEDGAPLTPDQTPLMRSLAGETVREFRELVAPASFPAYGRLLVREVNSAPVRDRSGEIVGAVAVVRTIA